MKKLIPILTLFLSFSASANDTCLASIEAAMEINQIKLNTTVAEFTENYLAQTDNYLTEQTRDFFIDGAIRNHFSDQDKAGASNNYLALLAKIEKRIATEDDVTSVLGDNADVDKILALESTCKSVEQLSSEIKALEVEYRMTRSNIKKKSIIAEFKQRESEIVINPLNLASAMNCYGSDYGRTMIPCVIQDLEVTPLRVKSKSELQI